MCLIVILVAQYIHCQTAACCHLLNSPELLRSLQTARQMSSFTSTLPSGGVLTTSLSVDLAFVSHPEGGEAEGVVIWL